MKIVLVYMTAGNRQEAKSIGKTLIESRLAACVNIIDSMNSLYRWQGELQDDQEVVMIAKTTEEKVNPLMKKVKAMHSYEVPCMLSFFVADGHGPFMEWIREQVS